MSIQQGHKKRIQVLSNYIKTLAQNINNNDLTKASTIIKNNKQKIDNNTILKFTFQTQIINNLSQSNKKLRDQVQALRLKKIQLQKQKYIQRQKQRQKSNQNRLNNNSGLINQKVGIHMVRFKITLSNIQDIQFEQASLDIDFQRLFIYNYQQQTQKILLFSDFLLVQKKNLHILLQYESQGQRRYLMIQCQIYDQALRIFRCLSFGKLIKQNQHRKSLFMQNDSNDTQRQSKKDQQLIMLSDSIDKSRKQLQISNKQFSKELLSSSQKSHKNSNNFLHLGLKNNYLNQSGYHANINNVNNSSFYDKPLPSLHPNHINSNLNNLKVSPYFVINRARGNSTSVFHSQFGPGGGYLSPNNQSNYQNASISHQNPHSSNFRKYSQDQRIRKLSFQNIFGREKNGGISQNSFDQSNSHHSHSNPNSPLQQTQPQSPILSNNLNNNNFLNTNNSNNNNNNKLDYTNFAVSKGIIQRQKQKQMLLQSFGEINNESNHFNQNKMRKSDIHHDSSQSFSNKNVFQTAVNYKIQQKDDQYKSKSSQNGGGIGFFRNSKESVFSNQVNSRTSRKNSGNDFDLKNFQAPLLKNPGNLQQSDYISQQEEHLQVSSPRFPKKINYGNHQSDNNIKKEQKQKSQSLLNGINLIKVDSQQLPPSDKNPNLSSQKQSSSPHQEQQSGSQNDSQSQDITQRQYIHGQETSEQSQTSSTSQFRKAYLQSGIILLKCSPDGFSPHQKKLYLSQNQVQIVYQDTKDKKKKNISLNDVDYVQHHGHYQGIQKHIPKPFDQQLCLVIKVKPCKATKNKSKNLQFYGKDKQAVQKYARYLEKFIKENIHDKKEKD